MKTPNNHAVILMLLSLVLVSCATQYHVQGSTDRRAMEGKTLYVKVFEKDNMVTIDSSIVRHGQLTFTGELDSAKFVSIYMDDEYVGPLVLEEGMISVSLNELQCELRGGPYNDTLNIFLEQFQCNLRNRAMLVEEYQRCRKLAPQLILDGYTEEESNITSSRKLNEVLKQLDALDARQDALETNFIVKNSHNILGPGVFMLVSWKHPYPYLTPQIEEILLRSHPYLREHPYVKCYIEAAKKNMEQMRE